MKRVFSLPVEESAELTLLQTMLEAAGIRCVLPGSEDVLEVNSLRKVIYFCPRNGPAGAMLDKFQGIWMLWCRSWYPSARLQARGTTLG